MSETQQYILHIPDNVREDSLAYRAQVEKFLKGDTSAAAFRAYRVPMGIYEQRTSDRYMVRVRIAAGLVLPHQLYRIAALSKKYGNGIIHITTRQDIQIHDVGIEDTPDILESLLEVNLSPRGGGGNTVRNITACPQAGFCIKENFNAAPYAVALAGYLLADNSSFNLPRKFKVAFSGCSDDCAYASVADLGFFAHIKDGAKGFAVYAGGGLGPNPLVATKIEEFIKDSEIFQTAEAVKRLFDKYGDRLNKSKARLRYVLAKAGPEEFVRMYKQELAEVRKTGLSSTIPQLRSVTPPQIKELSYVTVRLIHGDIPADDLIKVARIAETFGQGPIRTTQRQDIIIAGISSGSFDKTLDELRQVKSVSVAAKMDAHARAGSPCYAAPPIVVCTGAATCKLGLCLSKNLADAIAAELEKKNVARPSLRLHSGQAWPYLHGLEARATKEDEDFVIKISGCPNSCGSHHIALLGFEGTAKRIGGRLMPFYNVLGGAQIREGSAKLAERFGAIAAKKIPQFVGEALEDGLDKKRIAELVDKYSKLPDVVPEDYFFDFGQNQPFSLAGRGPGECGAGVMDVIRVDINQAKDAIAEAIGAQTGKNEEVYKALVAAARALLVIFGLEPKKDREVFSAFAEHLIKPGWVRSQTQQILDSALDWRMGDKASIENLLPEVRELIERIESLFASLDSNLKFRVEPYGYQKSEDRGQKTEDGGQKTEDGGQKSEVGREGSIHSIDLRGVACPMNFVKAKLELEKINVGEILEILLDEGEPVANVPASFTEQGEEVLEIEKRQNFYCVKVRRKN